MLFVPPTPDSELATKLTRIVKTAQENSGIKVKVVERAGKTLKSQLPGLREGKNCGRNDCIIHSTGGKGNCNKEGSVYKVQCMHCADLGIKSVYYGETRRSTYTRGLGHLLAIREPNKYPSNALANHKIDRHETRNVKFQVDVITTFKKPLERQVREGLEIYGEDPETY